ncbi:phosphoribosylformylglycinamidine synthase subunit PurS [Fructilactobacillus sp. Tb1]|uniref:phosphoribosylformylglycinamidine synthase subunit PurS n=1 Tax=Fructilactobacillus sp. Tb1 TaxID=3422304 RepID=UPI003D299A1B
MYLGKVYVSYKPSVFDPQGDVIRKSLDQLGFEDINQVKQGKYFEIKLDDDSKNQAEDKLKKVTESLLINPNTETYTYDLAEIKE